MTMKLHNAYNSYMLDFFLTINHKKQIYIDVSSLCVAKSFTVQEKCQQNRRNHHNQMYT